MTDFQFKNGNGTIDVTLRTDYIGVAAQIGGGENVTVSDIIGINTDTEKTLFANWQKVNYTIGAMKTFATTNSLTLTAIPVSKPGVPVAVLVA